MALSADILRVLNGGISGIVCCGSLCADSCRIVVRWGLLLALLPVCSAESVDFFRNGGIS